MLKRIDHVGVVVDNLQDARDFVTKLGMTLDHEFDLGRVQAAFYRCGDTMIEFLEVKDPVEREKRLGSDAARIEHIAFEVENLAGAVLELSSLGVQMKFPEPLENAGKLNNWTVPETSDGVGYQFVESLTPSTNE